MRLEAIMTRDVICVAPATPLKDVAALLVEHAVSGVPVCDDDIVVGVVSEADIVREEEGLATDLPRPVAWLLRRLDGELDRAGAVTAADVMSTPAVTARPTQHAADAARTMVERRIKRLPIVVDGGRLIGIVTRADLVRAFIRPDDELKREIAEDVLSRTLLLEPGQLELVVDNGRVTVRGSIRSVDESQVLIRCIRRIPGVVSVTPELSWPAPPRRHDDAIVHWP